jgi:hypothetical protein
MRNLSWAEERSWASVLQRMIVINFDINIGRAALEWNFYLILRGLQWSKIYMPPLRGLHVKQAVQHWIWAPTLTEEYCGKPQSCWPIAGLSGCKVTSSQQSGIKYINHDISPYLAAALFEHRVLFMFILWMSNEQFYIACAKSVHAYTHIRTYK